MYKKDTSLTTLTLVLMHKKFATALEHCTIFLLKYLRQCVKPFFMCNSVKLLNRLVDHLYVKRKWKLNSHTQILHEISSSSSI